MFHRSVVIITTALLCFACGTAFANSDSTRKPTCAIMTFQPLDGVSEGLAQMISERIVSEFGLSGQYKMIERTQAERVLKENQMAMVCLDTSLAIEAGKILAAEYVVIGSLGKVGDMYFINSRMVSVESGVAEKVASTDHKGKEENLVLIAAVNNARQLLDLPLLEVPEPEVTVPEGVNREELISHSPVDRFAVTPDGRHAPEVPVPKEGLPVELAWIPEGNLVFDSRRTGSVRRIIPMNGFWMSRHEITQDQWNDIMDSNPSEFEDGRNPVENVSWNDAVEFCRRLESIMKALQPDNESRQFKVRLPLDTEWEYACLAGAITAYTTGDTEADLDTIGWYSRNSDGKTHPVGSREPNRWGLFDMHGNVAEWCDNLSMSWGQRIVKGGSYRDRASKCAADFMDDMRPGKDSDKVGFRIVVVPL